MTEQPLPLIRTYYPVLEEPDPSTHHSEENTEDPFTHHSESRTDMEDYARHLEVIHNSGLHGWGIAGGLQVTATPGQSVVTIKPGIALQGGPEEEGGGRQISLAAGGYALINDDPDSKQNRVRVTKDGVTLSTLGLSGEKYLTIRFYEFLDEDLCTYSAICRTYHAPWLQFREVTSFNDNGVRLVLAQVSLDAGGEVKALTAAVRRNLDLPTGSLHFWRGQATSTPQTSTVENTSAGAMTVRKSGGLNLTVASTTDEISLAAQQGNFARLTLATEETIATGKVAVKDSLDVTGDLEVINAQNQPLLSVQKSGVGIGTNHPRTALDMGAGVFSGAASDYLKAQLAMSGGGQVTWGGSGGRLKWTESFIAPLTRSTPGAFGSGFVELAQPATDIPAKDVYNGTSRSANHDGVILAKNEALYAEHTIGGQSKEITYKIVSLDCAIFIPGNWLLVAAVSGNDNTVKLGTGSIVSARSSFSHGGSLPSGTILMWSGNINNIPDGWELCTGEGGRTPDLRSRFLVGAGGPGDEPHKMGEATQHTHTVGLNNTMKTGDSGKHSHQTSTIWYNRQAATDVIAAHKTYNGIDRNHPDVKDSRTSDEGSHSHTLPSETIKSSEASATLRPRWYALCFIMKL